MVDHSWSSPRPVTAHQDQCCQDPAVVCLLLMPPLPATGDTFWVIILSHKKYPLVLAAEAEQFCLQALDWEQGQLGFLSVCRKLGRIDGIGPLATLLWRFQIPSLQVQVQRQRLWGLFWLIFITVSLVLQVKGLNLILSLSPKLEASFSNVVLLGTGGEVTYAILYSLLSSVWHF